MNQLILILFLFTSIFEVSAANSVNVKGKITALRTQTSHHTIEATRGLVLVQLSTPLKGGCQWLSVEQGNTSTVSFLLSAQAQDRDITIWYYDDVKSKAWSTACQLVNIELK